MRGFDKLKALRDLMTAGKQGGDMQLGAQALIACADFCLSDTMFPLFAGWAASRPADSPYGWSSDQTLRTDVQAGRTLVETSVQMMPLVMSQLKSAVKEGE